MHIIAEHLCLWHKKINIFVKQESTSKLNNMQQVTLDERSHLKKDALAVSTWAAPTEAFYEQLALSMRECWSHFSILWRVCGSVLVSSRGCVSRVGIFFALPFVLLLLLLLFLMKWCTPLAPLLRVWEKRADTLKRPYCTSKAARVIFSMKSLKIPPPSIPASSSPCSLINDTRIYIHQEYLSVIKKM